MIRFPSKLTVISRSSSVTPMAFAHVVGTLVMYLREVEPFPFLLRVRCSLRSLFSIAYLPKVFIAVVGTNQEESDVSESS